MGRRGEGGGEGERERERERRLQRKQWLRERGGRPGLGSVGFEVFVCQEKLKKQVPHKLLKFLPWVRPRTSNSNVFVPGK